MDKEKSKNEKNEKNEKEKKEKKEIEEKDLSKENKDNKDNKEKKADKKNKKKEYKIFYSPYGYIKIDKSELDKNEPVVKFSQYRNFPFNTQNCLFGKISNLNYQKEINIQIKTFYNERAIYSLEKNDIFSALELVVKKIFEKNKSEEKDEDKNKDKDKDQEKDKEKDKEQEKEKEKNVEKTKEQEKEKEKNVEKDKEQEKEKEKNVEKDKDKDKEKDQEKEKEKDKNKDENSLEYKSDEEIITAQTQYRIFSCHKQIHELNPTRNLIENDIQDNEILLYLPAKQLSFSEYAKGFSIIVSQEGKIASKINTDEHQYVYGNMGYSFGKHYFEVNLLTEPIAKSVIVGLATKKNQKDIFSYEASSFYGYVLSDMQKISVVNDKQEKKDYNITPVGINDIIGVLFEFKKEGLEISFYKNKICLGVAFSKIYCDKLFFPVVKLGIAGSKVQISNQIEFP